MFEFRKYKRFLSGLLAGIMVLTMMLPGTAVAAEENSKFPYTMFAASNQKTSTKR